MSKEVKRFYIMPGSVPVLLSGDPAYTPMTNHLTDVHAVPLVLASDYDALLAERDRIRREGENIRLQWKEYATELVAERDALRKDAERYRWLREQEAEDGMAILPIGKWVTPAMLVTTPFDSPEMVDSVIDAAQQGEQP